MGSNGSACVAEARRGWLTQILAPLPTHRVSRPDHEVVALLFSAFVFEACATGLGPAAKHDDVTSRDVHGVAKAVFGGRPTYAQTRPHVRFSVQHADIVQVALLKCSALVIRSSLLHLLLIKPESAVDNQI